MKPTRLVIFVGEGRLGNQIIQYVALRKMFGASRIVSSSLDSLAEVFSFSDAQGVRLIGSGPIVQKLVRKVLVPVLLRPLFKRARLGTYVSERQARARGGATGATGEPAIQPGWLPIAFVDGGYYQNFSSLLSPRDFLCLDVRADLEAAARAALKSIVRGAKPDIAMHVRRGDYLNASAYGVDSIILGAEYYISAIGAIRSKGIKVDSILVLTDDPAWCRENLNSLGNLVFSNGSEALDFTLLTLFETVVISNSTFSLAAACVNKRATCVIGPKYWFGRAEKAWHPQAIPVANDPRFIYV